jgi:hypothetical protein
MGPEAASSAFDETRSLEQVSLRLMDAAAAVRLASLGELSDRLRRLAAELGAIEHEVRLIIHAHDIESSGLIDTALDLERRMAQGWEPPSAPLGEVLERLKAIA